MAYRCSVKRYGTVLYRYGGDLLHALNVSLGQTRMKSNKQQPLSEKRVSQINIRKKLSDVCLTQNAMHTICSVFNNSQYHQEP